MAVDTVRPLACEGFEPATLVRSPSGLFFTITHYAYSTVERYPLVMYVVISHLSVIYPAVELAEMFYAPEGHWKYTDIFR